jgi:hypothetical protein
MYNLGDNLNCYKKGSPMATYYIDADVHCNSIEMAIMNRGKIVKRYTIPTGPRVA